MNQPKSNANKQHKQEQDSASKQPTNKNQQTTIATNIAKTNKHQQHVYIQTN